MKESLHFFTHALISLGRQMGFPSTQISIAKLVALVEARGGGIAQLERDAIIASGTITNWKQRGKKNGQAGVNDGYLKRVCAVLGVPPEQLKVNGHFPTPLPSGIAPLSEAENFAIPEWDFDIRAGHWAPCTIAELDTNDEDQARAIRLGKFRLRIAGDCMEPDYKDGQTVEFKIVTIGRDPIEPGRDYVVCRSDGTATFKRMVSIDHDTITMIAANRRKYPKPVTLPWQEIGRIAVAVDRLTGVPEPRVPKIRNR